MIDLSLIPVDDLIAEIDKRSESNVILVHKLSNDRDSYDWHISGNRMTILGMLSVTIDHVKRDFEANETGGFTKD